MIFTSARLALSDLPSPPFRAALWKSLGLTALVLILLWIGVETVFEWLAVPFLSNLFPDAPPETSLQWVAPLRRWVELVIPFRTPRLSMRLAPALTGPWSEEVVGARPCPPSWRLRP